MLLLDTRADVPQPGWGLEAKSGEGVCLKMANSLENTVAIVTGAGRGIGRGIAVEFAKEGAHVVVASRSQGSIDGALEEISAIGGKATGMVCDVGVQQDIDRVVSQTVGQLGGLDILVNAAQSFGTVSDPSPSLGETPLEAFRDDEWEHTFLTGPTASYWFMKAAFPHLNASGRGRVINFGSCYGQFGSPRSVAYNAAKEATRALTRTAANEWGQHGITCNVINPGIRTDAMEGYFEAFPEVEATALQRIPMRRFGHAYSDAGRLAVFIAGPDASFLTGMTFMLDGGYYMSP